MTNSILLVNIKDLIKLINTDVELSAQSTPLGQCTNWTWVSETPRYNISQYFKVMQKGTNIFLILEQTPK